MLLQPGDSTWIGAAEPGFGTHRAAVRALMETAAAEVPADWDGVTAAAGALAAELVALPGEGTPGARLATLTADLRRYAEYFDPSAAGKVAVATDRLLKGRLEMAVGPAYEAAPRQLLEAALLWPAVFGEQRNPLAAAVDLFRMNVVAGLEGDHLFVYQHQLARPVALPKPQPRPATLQIARSMDF